MVSTEKKKNGADKIKHSIDIATAEMTSRYI